MRNIAVLGAGVIGVTTAYALSRRGLSVTVVDSHRYPASETSFANGGQLSASNAEVWNAWSTVFKGLGWMLRGDAPLLVNPRPGWHKYSWMAEFVAAIRGYEANTVETVRLAIAARAHLYEIAEREGIDFDLERRGILHVYRDRAGFDHASAVSELLRRGGLERRPVTTSEIAAIEPALKGDFYGGFFTPSDATGDIMKFTRGLAAACERQGVSFLTDTTVVGARVREGGVDLDLRPTPGGDGAPARTASFDDVVVCAGVGSRALAAMLGDRLNIYPVKGYSITVPLHDDASRAAAPWVSLLDDGTKIVSSRLGADRFRVAGTAEFNGSNRDIRADRIQPLVGWVRRHFPGVDTRAVLPWCGLRPMMPTMLPRVGPGRRPGVYYNTGHGHLGWTLACATAEIIADVVDAAPPARGTLPLAA